MRKLLLPVFYCLFFSCLALTSANAQQIFKTTSSSVIGYLEYVPQDYNANSEKYPVVIFLHGIGERGANSTDPATLSTTIQSVATHGPPMHVKNGVQFPFILISPQLKNNYGSWSSWYVMEVINHVKTYLRIDERRIYLTGLSLGGGGTWVTAQDYSALFAAIAPVCGGYNSTSKACNLGAENLPVWAFHGDADSVVPLSRSVNMVNAINNCTPTPDPLAKITIYPGVGHNSWTKAYKTDHSLHNPNVYEWLMSFTNTTNKGNKIPVANAGSDKTISLLNSVNISGSATDADGSIVSYSWSKISGPSATLLNQLTKTLTVSSLLTGTYVFRLTVEDNSGNTDSDYVSLTVSSSAINIAPVANAGGDKTITLPTNTVSITGSGTDADGSIASYAWTKISGGSASLSGTTTTTLNASNLVSGSYVFRLTVTDDKDASKSDDVTVTVKEATTSGPVANAGADKQLTLPANSLYITGSATASSGRVIRYYKWSRVSGPSSTLNDVSKQTVYIHSMDPGIHVFKLTVTDDTGAKATDNVQVTVGDGSSNDDFSDNLPSDGTLTANAGPDKVIILPANSLHITGSGTAPEGNVIRYYKWSRVSGPSSTLNDVSKQTVYIHSMDPGIHVFKLTVTDDKGTTATDNVQVTVSDGSSSSGDNEDDNMLIGDAPVANAGPDKVLTLPSNSLYITGSGTASPGRVIRYYKWSRVSSPGATLYDVSKQTVSIHNMKAGIHIFKLTVTDDNGGIGTDEIQVTVKDAITTATSFSAPVTEEIVGAAPFESEMKPLEDQEAMLGTLTSAQLKNSTVIIFNDSGKRIYSGAWNNNTYRDVLNRSGLYIYNVIKEGRRMDAGKIYIRE